MVYILSLIVFILVLGLLVLIHELGHFFAARFFKVRVEEFGFGLPPRVWGKKVGETIYSINSIPVGGFVKLTGEDEIVQDDPRSFSNIAPWKRAIIVLAGVVMNFFLAVVILTITYTIGGPIPADKVIVTAVVEGAPAQVSGLKPGDEITQVDSLVTDNPRIFSTYIRSRGGKEVQITLKRDGQTQTIKATPRKNPPEGQGPLGIQTLELEIKSFPLTEAPLIGVKQAFRLTGEMLIGLRDMFGNLLVKQEAPEDIGGVIRIAYMTHKAVQAGWETVLLFVGLLSLNLAILNALPLPALDGGRFVFILFEGITRRKIPQGIERRIHGTALLVLLLLVVLLTFQDFIWIWANTSLASKIQSLIP